MIIESLISAYLRRINREYLRFDSSLSAVGPPQPAGDRKYMLYVHIPFCESLCPFCSFHRVLLKQPKATRYFEALRKELQRYHEQGFDFSGVYVGGGTPTVVPEQLAETLALIRSLFSVEQISVETNPNHLRQEILSMLKAVKVNRLSVGVQSFDDARLKEMNRYGPYGSSAEIVDRLRKAQGMFDTLNVDMIFNLPHQTLASLAADIETLQAVHVDQVSFYPLMPAAATRRAMSSDMGEVAFHNEKRFYEEILATMRPEYEPASAWCFSRRKGLIDEYIVEHDEYIGAGSGSFSFLNGCFYSSTFSINRYIDLAQNGNSGITMGKAFTERERVRYDFLVKLFGLSLDKQTMEEKYRGDFRRTVWRELLFFKLIGALQEDSERYRLTEKGMYYWVVMMREFLTGVNNFREQMRRHIRAEFAMRWKPAEMMAGSS